jgi:hypothetical protein
MTAIASHAWMPRVAIVAPLLSHQGTMPATVPGTTTVKSTVFARAEAECGIAIDCSLAAEVRQCECLLKLTRKLGYNRGCENDISAATGRFSKSRS